MLRIRARAKTSLFERGLSVASFSAVSFFWVALSAGALCACSREPKARSAAGAPVSDGPGVASADSGAEASVASGASLTGDTAAVVPEAGATAVTPEPRADFPPAPLAPPYEKSAHEGDGQWRALGDRARGEPAALEPAAAYATVIHPHPVSRFLALHLAAVDLTAFDVHLMPGTDDVPDTRRAQGLDAKARRTIGLVDVTHRDRAAVVFNGGFQLNHGRWGFALGDWVLMPPRAEGCTVASLDDGSLLIGSWEKLQGERARMRFFRQTPPCLFEDGVLHPDLVARRERRWGGYDPKRKTRRRSALGIDRTGTILFYGVGIELEPSQLAEAMRLVGARSAAELDINFNWTRFLLVGKKNDPPEPRITSSLLEDMNYGTREYLERPSARDFFYLVVKPRR